MTEPDILLTGAGGFVGGAVLHAFARRDAAARVRLLVHRRAPAATAAEAWPGDLTDPEGLRGACAGVRTVVHAASYVGPSAERAAAVNDRGTRALLAEAARAGVERVVQVGTAAVYGEGVHRGEDEGALRPRPASPVSRSRLAGERAVLAGGGAVLRPLFVTGDDDVWFLPAALRLLAGTGAWIDEGAARLATIDVDALAAAVVDLALDHPGARGVLHATEPRPVTFRELVTSAARVHGIPLPERSVPLAEVLRDPPAGMSRRHVRLLAEDHWYDSSRLWGLLGREPERRLPAGR